MSYALHEINDLDKLVARKRNQLAKSKKAASSAAGGTASIAQSTLFAAMKPAAGAYFSIEDANGQKKKPFKPHITPQGRGKKRGRGGRGGRGRGQPRGDNKQNNQGREQSFRSGWLTVGEKR